jgi:hypothetical protein
MKAIKSLFLAAALTAAGFAGTIDVQAATSHGGGGGHSSGGHWSGGGHGSGGHYYGHGGHGGGSYWYPGWGFYLGAPLLWGAYYGAPYYWGSSYYPYDDYYYPRTMVAEPANGGYPPAYPEGVIESAPTTQVAPNAPGAPTQAPSYVNFCASANAYYPKVTSCPEGWKFLPSR